MREVSLFMNGQFHAVVSGPAEFVVKPTLQRWVGEWAEGALDDSWWFYGGMARKRQLCPVLVDSLVLRGVRPGSVIVIEGDCHECAEGGDVELSFQYPGSYEVIVKRWPYLDGSYIVENPPSPE